VLTIENQQRRERERERKRLLKGVEIAFSRAVLSFQKGGFQREREKISQREIDRNIDI
jgi:hypothetical protein